MELHGKPFKSEQKNLEIEISLKTRVQTLWSLRVFADRDEEREGELLREAEKRTSILSTFLLFSFCWTPNKR